MIKLIATDIDGTILVPEGEFTDEIKKCIKSLSERGIIVVLVTGRMNPAANLIANDLGLNTPIVSYQGGMVTKGNEILYERYLTKTQAESIIRYLKENKIHINLYDRDVLYSESDSDEIRRYCNNLHTKYTVKNFDEIPKNKVNKVLAIDYNNPEKISRMEKELPELFPDIYIVKSTPYFLEFSNKEASKYCAVKFLQNYLGIKQEETLAIGDQNNDISLLKAGGIKVAMGNATEELKACADYITDTVYNDGFIRAINKFCK